ncbi:Signal transduction histidine kinase [Amycolatopsis marina]|uniref:histidine kinase n=1 Tax=Amycolatopsis marina TaxID=490629 RepID=A0A1I1CPE2_9PSEU|nr:nitrate- and nitrite sensing domain-containing protein [Amycolatopsis marina]SFB64531.1 Signal transduction histidine kinase [Amycolatopsis marina]
MKQISFIRSRTSSIRSRVLAIALIPSAALLVVGVALAGYLVYDANQTRDFAAKIQDASGPALQYFTALQEERRLTLQQVAGGPNDRAALVEQRGKMDVAAKQVLDSVGNLAGDAPESVRQSIGTQAQLIGGLPKFREQVDAGQVPLTEAYAYYSRMLDEFASGLNGIAQTAPDAEIAYLKVTALPLFTSADGMQRGDALAAAAVAGEGLSEQEFRTYIGQVGAYHTLLEGSAARMLPEVRARYDQLITGEAWNRLVTVENAFLRGNQTELPVPEDQWRAAAREVGDTLMSLYFQQSGAGTDLAIERGEDTLLTSLIAGAAALLLAIGVFLTALRLSNRLVRRLARLREETLDVADQQLPELVRRVRDGEAVDLDSEVYFLDHGEDEIGQVADAFNKAQQTALAAAVDEAKTREGTRAVFLNIAHRNQVIVHRQLKVLDQAERKQEDPEQLDTLFKLDHLSTRARRNAENLIILGGQQPGRQWRNPVVLAELVRGASAETEDYTRVSVAKLPAIAVNGPVVGDLVHLLAELIDNATSFSPPESRVEIRGNVVGRGVVIEVEDQGLGIEPDQCEQFNAMLADPPDFGIMALSTEPRLGLFVVARLAGRHGISVTLRESAYGGTRAIVLVRSELLSQVPEPEEDEPDADAVPAQQTTRRRGRPEPVPDEVPQAAPARSQTQAPAQQESETPQDPATPPPLPVRPTRHRGPAQAPPPAPPPGQPAQVPVSTPAGADARQNGRFADAPTRTDLFRPQHPDARPRSEGWPRHEARPAQPTQPPRPVSPGRPPLPQRRRQQNLVPQLMDNGKETEAEQTRDDSPEQARNRLAAFQQGTRRAREQEPGSNDTSGDRA